MTNVLVRMFIKDSGNIGNAHVRGQYGRLAGWVGILSNFALFLLKTFIGIMAGSIAITADAVNNLSDSASSVITLVGFRLSGMPADEEHPYGHARFEYISGLVVSFLILALGLQFLITSVQKAISPEQVRFNGVVAVILVLSILIKLWQGMFNKDIGKRIDSSALKATATDSLNDVITTAAVLLSAVIAHLTGLYLDGWMGILVAIFILVSGIRMIIETLNPLLGVAPDRSLVAGIQKRIMSYPSVLGMHDLIIHNYGPGRCFASAHVEVPASQDILVSHDIIDNIERDFATEMNIDLVIHLDPIITDDQRLSGFRGYVADAVREIDPVLTIHDFRMVEGHTHTNLIFDVVIPPRFYLTDTALRKAIGNKVCKLNENYYCVITVDRSYTSTKTELMD